MDDEIDIEKIENFLQNLKNEDSIISECTTGSSVQNQTKQSTPVSLNSKEKQKYLQLSLKYNKECVTILSSLESSLRILLEECLKEQKIVRESIDAAEYERGGDNKRSRNSYSIFIRRTCSSPYFKDQDCFPSPFNEDFFRRKNAGYLDPWNVFRTVPWTNDQKRALEKSIKNINSPEKSTTCSVQSCTAVSTRFDENCVTKGNTNGTINFNEKKYDWIKISVVCLNSARNPLECRAMWFNYLHPKINKTRWTEKESKNLKMLVEKNNHEDWERIASDLGTSRSAYQCIGHFKIRLADFSKIKWTEKDYLLVQKLVKIFRVSNFTPWGKIAWLMDGRSTGEIYRKWRLQYGDLKKGTFSLQEDILLVAALKQFGEDWSLIAQYLPNRDNVQVRGRVMVLKGRSLDGGPWTPSEDKLLQDLVQKYGFGNWAKIRTHFICRTNVQLRTRYKSIIKWKERQTSDAAATPLNQFPKTLKDGRSLDGLWEAAQKIVQTKLKIDPTDSNSQINMIYELSQILKPQRKRGRKKGTVNFPLLQKEFYNVFHVAHGQRGGRGKDTYTEVPTLVYQTVLTLHLLLAKIVLPSQKELVNEECSILDMDKSVIMFLIDRKEFVLDNCKFIQFEGTSKCFDLSSSSVSAEHSLKSIHSDGIYSEWYPLCPPSGSTLIGLRTMLLNRANVREQSKGFTVQTVNTNSSQTLPRNVMYRSACKLWNKRLGMIYTWTAFLSKMYPQDQFIIDSTSQINDISSEEMKRNKRKRRKRQFKKNSKKHDRGVDMNVKGEDSNVTSPAKRKRTYVRSGKFSAKAKVSDSTRRHTRNTNTDC